VRPVWLIVVVLGWGCGGDDPAPKGDPSSPTSETPILPTQVTTTDGTTTDSVDTGTEPPDPAIATAEALFQPDHVVMVDIDMDPADAERLGSETNRIFDLLDGADCLDEPWSGPFNWYEADVTVDGQLMPRSGIRKKGLIGSLSSDKPSLKLDFDTFVADQELGGLERMTLNNSVSDGTLVKQCLGYQLFRDAGLPSPRCNFASVTALDEPLGVYVHVEPLKKDFLRWAFDGDDDGDLYEGTLSDFRAGWTNTFEPDTNDTDPSGAPILAVTSALELDDDDAMLEALGQVLDLDHFYRFWAMEVLIGHVDGFSGNTNNYYVYRPESSGKLVFLPWGIDSIFWQVEAFGADTTAVTLNNSALTRRLWEVPSERQRYLDTLQELLDTVWDEAALHAEVDRMTALVAPYHLDDGGRQLQELVYLEAFIDGRRAELEAAIAAEMPTYDVPLREGICLIESGSIEASFTTTWGTLTSPDPFYEGSAIATGTVDGEDFAVGGGAVAGDNYGYASIVGITLLDADTVRYIAVDLYTDDLEEGAVIAIDGSPYVGYVADIDFLVSEDVDLVAGIWQAELHIDTYSGVPGSPFEARLIGTLYDGGP